MESLNNKILKDKDVLIYDLLFSDNIEYTIYINDYIEDIYRYDRFILEMKKILKKSMVFIIKEKLKNTPDKVIWKIKVKR